MKSKFIVLLIFVLSISTILIGCKKSNEKGITYSNLADKISQKEVRLAMKNADISTSYIDEFFENVNYFNSCIENTSLNVQGFKKIDEMSPSYDLNKIQEFWNKKNPNFEGLNCRITSFSLFRDFMNIKNYTDKDDDILFMDKIILKNPNIKLFNEEEQKAFMTFFSSITTVMTKDVKVHVKKIQDYYKKQNITLKNSDKASIINVYLHTAITENENCLFIGHSGILIPTKDKLIFIEKLAFQEPYQALKFNNRAELKQYLMNKYGTEYGQDTAPAFIMENEHLM